MANVDHSKLLEEVARSLRMLLRHSLSKPKGGGVPDKEIYGQINKLNQILGDPHVEPLAVVERGSNPRVSVYTPQLPIDERDKALERLAEFLKEDASLE